jgi:hypothetical protein
MSLKSPHSKQTNLIEGLVPEIQLKDKKPKDCL